MVKNSIIKFVSLLIVLAVLTCGCVKENENIKSEDIIILYTSDIHSEISGSLSYADIGGYKNEMLRKTDYVSTIDLGDFLQGTLLGSLSRGKYVVDIMNCVGYDYFLLGNHEFDFGMEKLKENIDASNATCLACNFKYEGNGEDLFENIKGYDIKEYGDRKIAFVGVSTPWSYSTSTPAYFCENDERVYWFGEQNGPEKFYEIIQDNVDAARNDGADYVIVLSHLGSDSVYSPYSSVDLINNTSGIDAVLDGHYHAAIAQKEVLDKDGKAVLLSEPGNNFSHFGILLITESGNIISTVIDSSVYKDENVIKCTEEIEAKYKKDTEEVIGRSDYDLKVNGDAKVRLVRNRETAIGNLCADALRAAYKADIGLVNGGGIRTDINAGDIKVGNIISVHPFLNEIISVRVTGQQILDAFETAYRNTKKDAFDENGPIGENGGFLQVSGVKLTIDTSKNADFKFNENNEVVSISGERRVKDVMVLGNDGNYEPIDPQKKYVVASSAYVISGHGDGLTAFDGFEMVDQIGIVDYEAVWNYISKDLNGIVGEEYNGAKDRITVI